MSVTSTLAFVLGVNGGLALAGVILLIVKCVEELDERRSLHARGRRKGSGTAPEHRTR